MSRRHEQAQTFVDALFEQREGFAVLCFGIDPRWEKNAEGELRYKHRDFVQEYFQWPAQREQLIEGAIARSEEEDVYISINLHGARDRTKKSALPSPWVYADADAPRDGFEQELLGPSGMAVSSGRGQHIHLKVERALEPPEQERWNQRLARHVGGDAAWDAARILRLPGTYNHKKRVDPRAQDGERLPVKLLNGNRLEADLSLEELDRLLPAAGPVSKTAQNGKPGKKSHSEQEWSFLCQLARETGCDPEEMDKRFRASPLMRSVGPKTWDDPRGDTTYGWYTIAKVIAEVSVGFQGSDAQLLDTAKGASVRGDRFKRLLRGEKALYEGPLAKYESIAEAQEAAVSEIAYWCGPKPERIERLFRMACNLWNKDWDAAMVEQVLKSQTDFYQVAPTKKTKIELPRFSGDAPELAREVDILARLCEDLPKAGLVGEREIASLIYLQLVSCQLEWNQGLLSRPISNIVKGPSAAGKNAVIEKVFPFAPPWVVVSLSSMSRRFIQYLDEDFRHRLVFFPEWALIAEDEELIATIRTLLSEGIFKYGTVEAIDGQPLEARMLVKEGPAGLILPTTAAVTEPELETRCFCPYVDDTSEQTRRIVEAQGDALARTSPSSDEIDQVAWHETFEYMRSEPARVVIPFGPALGRTIPIPSERMRRDFPSLANLIRASAKLHAHNRTRQDGCIVAAPEDYANARAVCDALIASSTGALVPEALRQTVKAVERLSAGGKTATVKDIESDLGLGKGAAYNRVLRCLSEGYLENVTQKKRGYELALGSALPEEAQFLPHYDDLEREDADERD